MLTSMIGVAYTRGLSKDGNWSSPDAVIPVMKVGHRSAPMTRSSNGTLAFRGTRKSAKWIKCRTLYGIWPTTDYG